MPLELASERCRGYPHRRLLQYHVALASMREARLAVSSQQLMAARCRGSDRGAGRYGRFGSSPRFLSGWMMTYCSAIRRSAWD